MCQGKSEYGVKCCSNILYGILFESIKSGQLLLYCRPNALWVSPNTSRHSKRHPHHHRHPRAPTGDLPTTNPMLP